MNFINDNHPLNTYDDETTVKIMTRLNQLVATVAENKCASCGKILYFDNAHIYDHAGGWSLAVNVPKQWISFECPCGYHTSLSKLGRRR